MWRKFLIHHSATADGKGYHNAHDIKRYHVQSRGWDDVGYHFLIEKINHVPTVVMGRPLTRYGAHEQKVNKTAIGICFIGNYNESHLDYELLESGAKLIAGLSYLRSGTIEYLPIILPHRYYDNTDCPGENFPMNELRERVDEILKESNFDD